MNRERQGLRSTKSTPHVQPPDDDVVPIDSVSHTNTPDIICTITSNQEIMTYMDLCGKFPYRSRSGNEYMLVSYNYQANAILVEPIKNKQAKTMTDAWRKMMKQFEHVGVKPTCCVIDNEKSEELIDAFSKYKIGYKLVAPHTHRANKAERTIQVW